MKPDSIVCNRCRLVCVKFYLNRCRFTVVIAKCLGGSLFWGHTVHYIASVFAVCVSGTDTLLAVLQPLIVAVCSNPSKYNDPKLQSTATLALTKYMVVRYVTTNSNELAFKPIFIYDYIVLLVLRK